MAGLGDSDPARLWKQWCLDGCNLGCENAGDLGKWVSEKPRKGQARGGAPGAGLNTVPGSPPGTNTHHKSFLDQDLLNTGASISAVA